MVLIKGLFRFAFFLLSLVFVILIAGFLLVVGTIFYLIRGRRPAFQVYTQWPRQPWPRQPGSRQASEFSQEPEMKDVTPLCEVREIRDVREIGSSHP